MPRRHGSVLLLSTSDMSWVGAVIYTTSFCVYCCSIGNYWHTLKQYSLCYSFTHNLQFWWSNRPYIVIYDVQVYLLIPNIHLVRKQLPNIMRRNSLLTKMWTDCQDERCLRRLMVPNGISALIYKSNVNKNQRRITWYTLRQNVFSDTRQNS